MKKNESEQKSCQKSAAGHKSDKRHLLIIAMGILIIAGLFLLYKGLWNKKLSAEKATEKTTLQDMIKTAIPVQKDFIETRHFFGKVKSINKIVVTALETGTIIFMPATDGMPVTKGRLLFIIGGPSINYKLNTITNKIAMMKKRIVLAEKAFENNKKALALQGEIKQLKQRVNLAENVVKSEKEAFSEKFIKQKDFLNAKDALAAREMELRAEKRKIKNAILSHEDMVLQFKSELKILLQNKQAMENKVHVRAGFDGIFTDHRVSVGAQVQKGDKLGTIISQKNIYIRAMVFTQKNKTTLKGKKAFINLPESSSDSSSGSLSGDIFRKNQSGNQNGVCVKDKKLDENKFYGLDKISRTGRNIHENLIHAGIVWGTITSVLPERTAMGADIVWIKGHYPDFALKPGQMVSGNIVLSMHKKALAVPENALVRDRNENSFVFLKNPNSSGYHRQSVKTGIISHGMAEILKGLKKDDRIVVQGAYELFYNDFNKIYKVVD